MFLMSNYRFNWKINPSMQKYITDSTNESMRKKIEYFNNLKFANLLKKNTYKDENQANSTTDSNSDILCETTDIDKNNKVAIYNNYLYSFVYKFYSKIKTNFFVFLLLIYNGNNNK
jgi:hypothetical protein